ncbi:hypothetical protein ABL78_0982 [Leptomonas seymouri]|uniref:RanBP2-type domain-containing protein n=1 Tax=Leptomonas seymouri TaxID=5684 RepID=A0A0N1I1B5_LEPSE|nr:hypothetical protein ABL78_0982 [Leptomonas seymouri]|eukprot:KPI89910.1 hypothetical protein ABL78_0982 [Leptomonas seymouri]
MRRPHALLAFIARPGRRAHRPPAPRAWGNSTSPASSSVLPCGPETPDKDPSAQLVSFDIPSVHSAAEENGESAPAHCVFRLLQLQLRTSLLSAVASAPTPSSSSALDTSLSPSPHLRSKAPFGHEQPLVMLRQLRREVHSLAAVLLSHHQSQLRLRKEGSQNVSESPTTRTQYAPHRSSSGSHKKRDGRSPVQLIPPRTDAEQALLQPLQLDIVQQVLARLTLAEGLYQVALSEEGKRGREPASSTTKSVPASSSRAAEGAHCDNTIKDAVIDSESRLFFQECTQVAATLAALLEPYESDAQPLACLAHVLRASASASAPVPVTALIEAVVRVQNGKPESLPKDKPDEGSASSVPSPSEPLLGWCSCVPWLLHRYAVTQLALPGSGEDVSWPAASAWMTAAADRVCASEASELLYLSSVPSGGPSSTVFPGHAVLATAPAGMLWPWQRVLDQQGNEAIVACADSTEPSTSTNVDAAAAAGDEQLWSWLANRHPHQRQEVEDEELREGSLRSYWKAVVREVGSSGAEAVEVLMSAGCSINAGAGRKHAGGGTGIDSRSSTKRLRQHHSPSTLTPTQLKDMQFHAIGSYVAFRRMASSLQRHRRLVPLLQLHGLVSGHQPHRDGPPHGEGSRWSASHADDKNRSTAGRLRHRILSGELMGAYARHNPKRQDGNDSTAPIGQQVHQAGAMLWREVALFDAYTLITLGHVSEHAVDVAALDKSLVLQRLSWLQQECIQHLRTLESTPHSTQRKDATARPTPRMTREGDDASNVSQRLSPARAKVLRSRLTPRTRATLIEKLREGLRLSAKVLARWGESGAICQLYRSHPGIGASWEVGRALLQCGHYEMAVEVLKSLLETSPTTGRGPPSATSLLSSSAASMRQMLLEAMQGAASALVAQQHQEQRPEEPKHKVPLVPSSLDVTQTPLDALAGAPFEPETLDGDGTEGSSPISESEADAPLSAELRTQLHALYTHSASLPVPLPLCLHAVMEGLTEVSCSAVLSSAAGPRLCTSPGAIQLQHGSLSVDASGMPSDEQLRRVAVLCTYVIRCHLVERPSCGLLSKTVKLWASCVARYLCRRGDSVNDALGSASCSSSKLSMTDRYLREVAVRLFLGYPHIPVARLLLTRLLQQWSMASGTAPALLSTAGVAASAPTAGRSRREERAAWTVRWLLNNVFRYAGGARLESGALQARAYPVCTPGAAIAADSKGCMPWWNADFTERYTQDTLRLMPRIALENLEQFLSEEGDGLQHVLDRVQVALYCRRSEEDAQNQPWQCTTCYLWNSRYASACKRCHALATSLLQCRQCEFFNSCAGYEATSGLSCEVCGTLLVAPTGEESPVSVGTAVLRRQSEASATRTPQPPCSPSALSPSRPATVGAATVTGSGRPASLFRDSPNVLRVVSLRPWSCAHCRTVNEARHAFFCRGCGRPQATDMAGHIVAAAALQSCGCCGYLPKTLEGRLSPFCERCGSLHERLQRLFTSASASTTTRALQPEGGGDRWGGMCGFLRSPTLWWCGECVVALNPWARTHCSLCGAGRPPRGAASAPHPVLGSESTCPDRHASSLANGLGSAWRHNVAAPFITVPWSMQPCGGCQAPNRVGGRFCWRCGAEQSWPASVMQTISTEWQHWLTQVSHAVTAAADEDSPSCREAGHPSCGERSEQVCHSDTGSTALPASRSATSSRAPLRLRRTERWVCLRDGCLHLNSADVTQNTSDTVSPSPLSPVCCAACHAPRRHVEVFNPFRDRLCWRRGGSAVNDASSSPSHKVVEALLLPRDAPRPTETLTIELESSSLNEPAAHALRVVRRPQAALLATCVCCGAPEQEDGSATSTSEALHRSQPIRVRPLFLVNVCQRCGHCSRGRSCGAYDTSVAGSLEPTIPCCLLPGEEALALRLLLRSLAQSVQQALVLEEERRGRTSDGCSSRVSHREPSVPSSNHRFAQALDWAWLSRHVLSAVQLFMGSSCKATSIGVVAADHDDHGLKRQEEEFVRLHDALLPWRGCDVASARQLCSVEPSVAVLSDAAGTVHSALIDVREVLENICSLVDLRVSELSAVARRPSRFPLPTPLCLQDAWTRRLLLAALDLIDVVNRSTACDEVGFATLRRLCCLLRPHELDHIDTETKWRYLQEMKLSRSSILHGCVACERCLRDHAPEQPCSAL